MVSPPVVAIVFTIVAMVTLPLTFAVFKVSYTPLDIALASLCAGLLTLVPAVGQWLSLIAMAAILERRLSASLMPDILVAVAVSRLCVIPVLLLFELHHTSSPA